MNEKAIENRIAINNIKTSLDLGLITYDEAKKMAEPVIKSINDNAIELSKKYNIKPQLVDFRAIIR